MNQRERSNSADARSKSGPELRVVLSRLLISGGILLTGLVIALALALILHAAGDEAGARAVGYVAWVAAGCFAIVIVALLSAVTLAVVQLLDRTGDSSSEPTSVSDTPSVSETTAASPRQP